MSRQYLVTTSHSVLLVDVEAGSTRVVHRGGGLYYGITASASHLMVAARGRMVSSDLPGSDERGRILLFGHDLAPRGELEADFALRDMHEIRWHEGRLWVTCSYDNMVAIFDGRTWRRWFPLGEPQDLPRDRNHFNSLHFEPGKVAVLAHNWGASTLNFFDIHSLAPLQSFSLGVQAHNVWEEGGEYFTCSSGEGLIVGHRGFRAVTGGFPRGIARTGGTTCVGISELAERTERDFTTGILRLYGADWQPLRECMLEHEGLVLDIRPHAR